MSGFTQNFSNLPPGCTDAEIERAQDHGRQPKTRMRCCTCNKPILKGERYSITPSGKRRHKGCLQAHMDSMKSDRLEVTEKSYPVAWPHIAKQIKDAAGWICERCKHPHDVASGHVLTVHHLDGNKANCANWNLAALCQRCHLTVQGRVTMHQHFMQEILPVSEWFRPHLEGYLASLSVTEPACSRLGQARSA